MNEKILFKTVTGSYLYGTNGENSDRDYKFVFVPNLNDLLLSRAPEHLDLSTNSSVGRNTKDDVDDFGISLKKFLYGVASGETNALDILFAGFNEKNILIKDPIWDEILENIDKLITKNVKAYIGFAVGQSIRYSLKGDKLNNFTKFHEILFDNKNLKDSNGKSVLLRDLLYNTLYNNIGIFEKYEKRDKVIGERAKVADTTFGDHVYILRMNNKEEYLMISDVLFNFDDTIVSNIHKVNNVIKSYGDRSKLAADNAGADYKALSHAVRVLFQAEELLRDGFITFPLRESEREFVKSIKFKTTDMSFEDIVGYIGDRVEELNRKFDESELRSKADYVWIDEFIIKVVKKVNGIS